MSPVTVIDVARRRLSGHYVIDEWGYDADLVDLLDPVLSLRWHVEVVGEELLPASGPGVLVVNRRFGVSEPFVVARGVRRATGRRVRFLGIPDAVPLGPLLRRVGGAVDRPDELGSLLRAGHLCVLPLRRDLARRRVAGTLAPEALAPAFDVGAPVVPVAVVGRELAGRWRVLVGEPLPPPALPTPLALAELAEAVHDSVQGLLDEAFPPRWLLG